MAFLDTAMEKGIDTISKVLDLFTLSVDPVSDINKEADKNTLTIYGVITDNIPPAIKSSIAKMMECKIAVAINTVIENTYIKADDKTLRKYFEKRFKNNLNTFTSSSVDNAVDRLVRESVQQLDFSKLGINMATLNGTVINESRVKKAVFRRNKSLQQIPPIPLNTPKDGIAIEKANRDLRTKAIESELDGTLKIASHALASKQFQHQQTQADVQNQFSQANIDQKDRHFDAKNEIDKERLDIERAKLGMEIDKGEADDQMKSEYKKIVKVRGAVDRSVDKTDASRIGTRDRDYISSTGTMYSRVLTGFNKNNDIMQVPLSFRIRVNLLEVPSDKIIESLQSISARDTLHQYMKMRAGSNKFFKDFVLNLNEIDKEVKRNTSAQLEDRILSDMTGRAGFLVPRILGDLYEAKHYMLIVDKVDLERMDNEFNIDFKKTGNLRRVFDHFKILSFIVVDSVKRDLIIYDSDNPLKGNVVSYGKYDNEEDMMNIFKSLTGR